MAHPPLSYVVPHRGGSGGFFFTGGGDMPAGIVIPNPQQYPSIGEVIKELVEEVKP